MDNTLLVCLSHQLVKQRAMESIANNIANANTSAYRREEMKFDDYVQQSKPSQWQSRAQGISFVVSGGTVRDLTEGQIENTGNTFDLAIGGSGYFAVQTARGERYTRDGHFRLDAQGQITTESGDVVLSDGGPITIANEDGDVSIGADGTISGDQGQIAKLRVVQFADERALTKEGNDTYAASQPAQTAESGYAIQQGMLERSNVEPITEMTNMIDVMRSYQAVSGLITAQESLKLKAVDKLASIAS